MTGLVLGIDPGTRKAGFALIDTSGQAVEIGIEAIAALEARVRALRRDHPIETIAIGRGTNARALSLALGELGIPIALVDERETTLRARSLYWADHPPRGWRRFVPQGMQVPPRPIDDYAALLIARRYLADAGAARA